MFGRRKRADLAILEVLAGDWTWYSARDLMQQAKLRSRRFYASMGRLIEAGLVERRFEKTDERPRRALYRLRVTR